MMLIVVILALGTGVYALTVASLAWEDLVSGAVLTAVLLAIFWRVLMPQRLPPNGQVLKAILYFPLFVAVALIEIMRGTWQVATFVTGIRKLEHPGIIRVPLGRRSKASTGLAGLVLTLSPGTFLVDVDWEHHEMLVHAIDASDPDALREGYDRFYENIERHIVP